MLLFLLMTDVIGCLQENAKWERHQSHLGDSDLLVVLEIKHSCFEYVLFLTRYVLVTLGTTQTRALSCHFQRLTDIRDAEKLGPQSLVCFKTPMAWGLTDDISGSQRLALIRSDSVNTWTGDLGAQRLRGFKTDQAVWVRNWAGNLGPYKQGWEGWFGGGGRHTTGEARS